jgi:thioredoxin-dependent peroxiredoxin
MPRKTTKVLSVGDTAPDFTLPSTEGKEISLKDFIGKKVVLYFYPKDMTPGCTTEACSFRDNYVYIKKQKTEIIGISADSVASHQKFVGKYNLPFMLLSDPDKKISELYGVWKKKSLYGKLFFGIERSTFIIDEHGKIKAIFRKVKVKQHTEEVLNNLY